MKRYEILIYIGILFILLFVLTGCTKENKQNVDNVTGSKLSANINTSEQQAENRVANILQSQNEINLIAQNELNQNTFNEKEIASYSTTIKDKAEGRLTNISITCSSLNNTIIRAGDTFSFNKVIGKPTTEKGYKEATVIIDHKSETGIGGGNCQVSSTLYNAVLAVPNLVVTERHEHGKDVTYVPEGKDAAVSYGSLDLKFKNNLGHDLRIEAITDNKTITIKLIQL